MQNVLLGGGHNENMQIESELHSTRILFAEALEEKQKEIDCVKRELTETVKELELENSLLEKEKIDLKSLKDSTTKKYAATRWHLITKNILLH